jgi:hypothetical protein
MPTDNEKRAQPWWAKLLEKLGLGHLVRRLGRRGAGGQTETPPVGSPLNGGALECCT